MKRSELFLILLLFPLDVLAVFLAGLAAYFARFHPVLAGIRPVIFQLPFDRYAGILILVSILWIGVFALAGLYNIRPRPLKKELARLLVASAVGMAVIFSILFFSRSLFESRFIVLAGWPHYGDFSVFGASGCSFVAASLACPRFWRTPHNDHWEK